MPRFLSYRIERRSAAAALVAALVFASGCDDNLTPHVPFTTPIPVDGGVDAGPLDALPIEPPPDEPPPEVDAGAAPPSSCPELEVTDHESDAESTNDAAPGCGSSRGAAHAR